MDFNLHEGKKYTQQSKIRKHIQHGGDYSPAEIKHAQELLGNPFRLFMEEIEQNGSRNYINSSPSYGKKIIRLEFSDYILAFTYAFKVLSLKGTTPNYQYFKLEEILASNKDAIVANVNYARKYKNNVFWSDVDMESISDLYNKIITDVNTEKLYIDFILSEIDFIDKIKYIAAHVDEKDKYVEALAELIHGTCASNCGITMDKLDKKFLNELRANSYFYDKYFYVSENVELYNPETDNIYEMSISNFFISNISDNLKIYDKIVLHVKRSNLKNKVQSEQKVQNGGNMNIMFRYYLHKYLSKKDDTNYLYELRDNNASIGYILKDLEGLILYTDILIQNNDNDNDKIEGQISKDKKLEIMYVVDFLNNVYNKITEFKDPRDYNEQKKKEAQAQAQAQAQAYAQAKLQSQTQAQVQAQLQAQTQAQAQAQAQLQAQTQAQLQSQTINKISYVNIPSMNSQPIYGGPKNSTFALDQRILRTDNNITPELANFNFALGQIHLKDQKEWSRDENGILQKFTKGPDGKFTQKLPLELKDMCLTGVDIDETKCTTFLESAGLNKTIYSDTLLKNLQEYFNDTSGKLINNFDTTTLAKVLGNVHPNLAAHVLLNFGFKRVTEKNPNTGLVTDTLQDVKSWLRDLSNDKIAESKFGNSTNVKNLRDAVGLNGNFGVQAQNILTYFHILREWVTANPGVLNDEFVWKNPTDIKLDEPAPNNKFKLYAYKSPQLKIALSKVNDNLSRLKTTILKYGGTFNPEKTLNDTIKTPWPLHAPLNPYAYAFPHSPLNPQMFMGQAGGDASAIQAELEKNGLSGAKLLKEAYNSIVGILKVDPINKTVSDHTDTEMNDRLKKLEEAEASVYQSMNNLVDRYRLYIASKGQIDVLRVQDDDLPALMKKHTELFNKTQSYTKKCTNIITCLQKLADIAEKALEKESQ
jgi:hypothetical protein